MGVAPLLFFFLPPSLSLGHLSFYCWLKGSQVRSACGPVTDAWPGWGCVAGSPRLGGMCPPAPELGPPCAWAPGSFLVAVTGILVGWAPMDQGRASGFSWWAGLGVRGAAWEGGVSRGVHVTGVSQPRIL